MDRRALSKRERDVARAAATGATTRQIADALFVNPRTVESHLSSIYRKIGVANRAALVASIARGLLDDEPLEPPRSVARLRVPEHFVGRRSELDRIAAIATECATGAAQVAMVCGEPGAGKSSLVAAAVERIGGRIPPTEGAGRRLC